MKHDELKEALAKVEASPDYKVLRRLRTPQNYSPGDNTEKMMGVYLDVETTGLSSDLDKIIQLSVVPFAYSLQSGRVGLISQPISYLEDPGRPIPAQITLITGITDQDVAGQKIDDKVVDEVLRQADICIAHNAGFDRQFLEKRYPDLKDKAFGCSMNDIPWLEETGVSSRSLEILQTQICGNFFRAHDAVEDCLAGIDLIAKSIKEGKTGLSYVLEKIKHPGFRVKAVRAPFNFKDRLKARQYRWFAGSVNAVKCWFKDLADIEVKAELEWLAENIYNPGRISANNIKVCPIDPLRRYSNQS
jgi:DNA polymerase III subunit epsilon